MRRLALTSAICALVLNPLGVQSKTVAEARPLVSQRTLVSLTAKTPAPSVLSNVVAKPQPEDPAVAAQKAKQARVQAAQAALTKAGLNPAYAELYLDASDRTGTPWQLLAAVHETETGQRGDTYITSYAGAQGPMQFMPSTFAAYAVDGNGDGVARINDVDDAVYTAGHYLAANGADRGDYFNALLHYNHSTAYANHVMAIAQSLGLK